MSTTDKRRYGYIGQRYQQGSSSLELISFCASANDIKEWAGVPQKTAVFHGGFQRALGPRYRDIIKFFDDGQASPTSIVIAFREGALKVTPLGYPAAWTEAKKLNNVPQFVHLSFESEYGDVESSSLEDLRAQVSKMLSTRLSESVDPSHSDEDPMEELEPEQETELEADVEEIESSTSELDVGHSKLRGFYEFISNPASVSTWLSEENSKHQQAASKPKKTKNDLELLTATPEQRLKALLVSLLRPAMIVDGQHRVWGAYDSTKAPITFSVCAIAAADWVEQVFQFVVLNRLARPISASFLTSILNTSLTNTEVSRIEKRLDEINIRNTDRVVMKYLNHDPRSPFAGLIAEPGEVAGVDNRGKLSDKGMIRLAKRWIAIRRNKKEIQMFSPALGAKKLGEARAQWREYETWVPYFYAFWEAVKGRFQKEGLWEKRDGAHLLYIVTMHAMQDMYLDAKAKADSRFTSVDDFRQQVTAYFEDVPTAFFQGWKTTGLQSGDGPRWIKEAIEELRSGTRLGTLQENSPLYAD